MIRLETWSKAGDKAGFAEAFNEAPETCRATSLGQLGLPEKSIWSKFLAMGSQLGAEFWLCFDGPKVVGRLGVSPMPRYPGKAALGFFEASEYHFEFDKICQQMFAAAKAQAGTWGAQELVGPLNFNTWFSYRFQCDAFDSNRFIWEPNNPKIYPEVWQKLGFSPLMDYASVGVARLDQFAEKTASAIDRCREAGYSFRPFAQKNFLEREIPILFELSMRGFADNFLMEPIPFHAFRELYVPVAKKADFSLSFFALDSSNKEVGFFFCLIDQGYLVMKSAAVIAEARGVGLSNALSHLAAKAALARGIDRYITALVREGAQSDSYRKKGEKLWEHHYRLFSRKNDGA